VALINSVNFREELVTDYSEMSRTGLQNVLEMANFKVNAEALNGGEMSAQRVANACKERAKLSDHSEPITDTMVDRCLKVHARALQIPSVYESIVKCEEHFGVKSQWHWVSNMHCVIDSARSPKTIAWVFDCVSDGLTRGIYGVDSCTQRWLVGEKGSRGMVEVFVAKLSLKDYLLGTCLDWMDMTATMKQKARNALANHDSYSTSVAPRPGEGDADLSWQVGMTSSMLTMTHLIESLVYSDEHDGVLKSTMKTHKAAPDIMSVSSLKAVHAEILEARKTEKDAETASAGPSASMAGDGACDKPPAGPVAHTVGEGSGTVEHGPSARQLAERKVRAHIRLITETSTEASLANALRDTPAVQCRPSTSTKFTAIVYDVLASGECLTQPHLRTPPLREPHLNRLVRGAVRALSEDESLPGNVQWVMFDGGHGGHERVFKGVAKPAEKSFGKIFCTRLNIFTSEESVKERRRSTRGVVRQLEVMYTFTSKRLQMPPRPRKFFSGSNRGDSLGVVVLDATTSLWSADVKTEKAIYGKNRVSGGLPTDDSSDGSAGDSSAEAESKPRSVQRTDDTIEPVFFGSRANVLCNELLATQCWEAIVHLTAMDGKLALAAIRAGKHYTCVFHASAHRQLVRASDQRDQQGHRDGVPAVAFEAACGSRACPGAGS